MAAQSASTKPQRAVYQPFQCEICQSRFTRQENLKRHAALHAQSAEETSLPCGLCSATFSRKDLRQRHIRHKHGDRERKKSARTRSHNSTASGASAVDDCVSDTGPQSTSMTGSARSGDNWIEHPDFVDEVMQVDSELAAGLQSQAGAYVQNSVEASIYPTMTGTTNLSDNSQVFSYSQSPTDTAVTSYSANGPSPNILQHQEYWFPSPDQIARGIELYFRHVSHFVPFLHQTTFNEDNAPPYLTLSMLCLAYRYDDDEDGADSNDRDSFGTALAIRCFHRARVIMMSIEEIIDNEATSITVVQAYVLLQICAMMYLCGRDSTYALRIHPRMVALVRSCGLMQPRTEVKSNANDLDSLWREFVWNESRKRTVYAVHQLDALYYQLLSMPRSISHLEIRHDLPCPTKTWNASTAAEWAHKQLTNGSASVLPSYNDTIRKLLSSDTATDNLPDFDSYGTINIAQFLISSAREISGWSAMTGRVSMDRFEPLRSALEALLPLLRSQSETDSSSSSCASASQATWEMAMIELQMWSPSHTAGSVANSVDSVLRQWTSACRGPWSEVLFNASKAVQPHVDWFLRYLETTIEVEFEPPWVALYAYKAFLAALELLQGGVKEAMSVVGIGEGERRMAVEWARRVFGRRQNWPVGRLILKELDGIK